MAVFLVNICKFNGCGLTYPSLGDLIQHIEETHLEYESDERPPPSAIPLSSALRFFAHLQPPPPASAPVSPSSSAASSPRASSCCADPPPLAVAAVVGRARSRSPPPLPLPLQPARANSTGSTSGSTSPSLTSEEPEYDVMSDISEDSNDSWTTQEEFSAEFIMKYGSKKSMDPQMSPSICEEKPYSCPVPGCKKRYKNVNGIKYHAKHGHKKDAKIRKAFKCHCGKSYKTAQGLKQHALALHPDTPLTTITTAMGEVLQIPTSQVTTLQPVRVSLSALMAGGLSALPVKTVAARHLVTRPAARGPDADRAGPETPPAPAAAVRDLKERGRHRHAIALSGVSRATTIQVAVPASGLIPLSSDRELTAVPVSRLLATGQGSRGIRLAQLGAHATGTITARAVKRPRVVTASCTAATETEADTSAACDEWDPDSVLVDSRPSTPRAAATSSGSSGALPPTPVTPGSAPVLPVFPAGVTADGYDDELDALPPTPASLLDVDVAEDGGHALPVPTA